jgi:hypothetical protein
VSSATLETRPGVRALLEVLNHAELEVSVGRVCGSRFSAVWLGDDLELVSVTLEAHELDDAETARGKALEFVEDVQARLS